MSTFSCRLPCSQPASIDCHGNTSRATHQHRFAIYIPCISKECHEIALKYRKCDQFEWAHYSAHGSRVSQAAGSVGNRRLLSVVLCNAVSLSEEHVESVHDDSPTQDEDPVDDSIQRLQGGAQAAPQAFGGNGSRDAESELELPRRILVSTGDVMGDIHAAAVVEEILQQATVAGRPVEVYAVGSQKVKSAGATLIGDTTGLSSIGLWEALPLVAPSLRVKAQAEAFLQDHPPHAAVLVDYPGFNIPFGRHLKKQYGCPITYYIPPNEWLFTSARTATVAQMSDTILAVYHREAEHYAKAGGKVLNVSHPLLDFVRHCPSKDQARRELGLPEKSLVVALVPASRRQEVRLVWPVIAAAARVIRQRLGVSLRDARGGLHFVLPVAEGILSRALEEELHRQGLADITTLWTGSSHTAMAAADLAITKSGSATLELALLKVPQVVVYKVGAVTAWIGRNLLQFNLPWVSLVNLIAEEQAVPEFIQERATPTAVAEAALALLSEGRQLSHMLQCYDRMQQSLGNSGAARRAARHVLGTAGIL